MTLIHIFKHVLKHGRYVISLAHILKHEDLVKESTEARDYHLNLDRDANLSLEASIGQILLVGVVVIVDHADHRKHRLLVPFFQLLHAIGDLLASLLLLSGCDVNVADEIPELDRKLSYALTFTKIL